MRARVVAITRACLALHLSCAAATAGADRLHVRANAAPGGDGLSWATAIDDLQTALNIARIAPASVSEIWVSQGVYKPTIPYTGPGQGDPADPRSRAFLTAGPNIPVYGGFRGDETALPSIVERRYPTILSGDLAGNDNFAVLPGTSNHNDNVYHVVRITNGGCWLNGFTIRSGVANSLSNNFDRNGGGVRTTNFNMDVIRLEHCRIFYNFAQNDGAGLYNNAASRVTGCTFLFNRTTSNGAGVRSIGNSLVVVNSAFYLNNAQIGGGAALVTTFATFTNCTVNGNIAFGGTGGLQSVAPGALRVSNGLFWGNNGHVAGSNIAVFTSWMEGINPNPLLLDFSGPDGVTFTDDDYPTGLIGVGSPCIDGANNSVDIDLSTLPIDPLPPLDMRGMPRVQNGDLDASTNVDYGAVEIQAGGELVYRLAGSGGFNTPAAWLGGVVPSIAQAARFDRNANVQFPASFSQNDRIEVVAPMVTFVIPDGGAYQAPVQDVTSAPGMIVERGATLNILTATGLGDPSDSNCSAYAVSVGDDGPGTILVDGEGMFGSQFMRLHGANTGDENLAYLRVNDGASLVVNQLLSIGAEPGEYGRVELILANGFISHPLETSHVFVGHHGRGELVLKNSSYLYADDAEFCVACEPGSRGDLDLLNDSLVYLPALLSAEIGRHGDASVIIDDSIIHFGGPATVEVAPNPGSVADIRIRLDGQLVAEGPLQIGAPDGAGGAATILLADGSTITAPEVRLAPGAVLSANGAIDGDFLNSGILRLQNEMSPQGLLTVTGDYTQFRDPASTGALSGRLELNFTDAGPDQVVVQGAANLGGGVYFELSPDGHIPFPGELHDVIQAASINGAFNVVSTPIIDDRYFFRVLYSPAFVTAVIDAIDIIVDFGEELVVPVLSAIGEPLAGVVDDFNGDMFPDLAVVLPNPNPLFPGCVLVLLNQGLDPMDEWLGFAEFAQCVTVGLEPSAIAFVNGDLLVANFGSNTVTVLRNNGEGDFGLLPPLHLSVPAGPIDLGAASFDGDGFGDAVVASNQAQTLTILYGVGAGLYNTSVPFPIGASPTSLTVNDLVPGGGPDVAVACRDDGVIIVVANDGVRSLGNANEIDLPPGSIPDDIDSGDVDGDKDIDIVCAVRRSVALRGQEGEVLVFIADAIAPNGFLAPSSLPIGDNPLAVTLATFDDGGPADIAVIAEVGGDRVVQVLQNTTPPAGSATFAEPTVLASSGVPRFLLTSDVDNDADTDVVTLNEPVDRAAHRGVTPPISVLLNTYAPPLPGDVNFDGFVSFEDLNIVLGVFNTPGFGHPADLDDDGFIGFPDLNIVLSYFNTMR